MGQLGFLLDQALEICRGIPLTLAILVTTFVMGASLAVPLAAILISRQPVLSALARTWVRFFLATPPIVHVFWVYYALPVLTEAKLSAFESVVTALCAGISAMMVEVFRAGYAAIPRDQHRAAAVLGLSPAQRLYYVIFPQMLRHVLAPTLNVVILLMKETALASVIAIPEILGRATLVAGSTYRQLEAFTFAAGLYFVITYPLILVTRRLETRARRGFARQ